MNLAMYHFLFKIKTHTLHLKAEKVTNDLKSASHEQRVSQILFQNQI